MIKLIVWDCPAKKDDQLFKCAEDGREYTHSWDGFFLYKSVLVNHDSAAPPTFFFFKP